MPPLNKNVKQVEADVAKTAADLETSKNAAAKGVELTSQAAREKLRARIKNIPGYLEPPSILATLGEDDISKMEEFVENDTVKIEQTEVIALAKAILATEIRGGKEATRLEGKAFREELHTYLRVVGTTTATNLPLEQQRTEAKLIEIYKGLASYHVDAEAVRGDSKGQLSSVLEKVEGATFEGLNKLYDAYSDAEPYQKLIIAGVGITFALWSMASESESASNIRKTVLGGLIIGGGALTANWLTKVVSGKSAVERLEDANATADVYGLINYLEIQGEKAEEVAETLVDGMLFNPETKHLTAKEVFAKTHSLKNVRKEQQVLDYDKENLDPALFYRGVVAFEKRLERLKVSQPEIYAEIQEAIDNDAELSEIYTRVLALDPDAWQIKHYHTYVGGKLTNEGLNLVFDTKFEDYLEEYPKGFSTWYKSTKMHSAYYKNSPELLTEQFYIKRFGGTYENMLELSNDFEYSNILHEALVSNKPQVDVAGRKYMAVNVAVKDGETPDVYIKRAYKELVAKYKIKGEVEPVLGTLIEEPSPTYMLMVRDADPKFNPIV